MSWPNGFFSLLPYLLSQQPVGLEEVKVQELIYLCNQQTSRRLMSLHHCLNELLCTFGYILDNQPILANWPITDLGIWEAPYMRTPLWPETTCSLQQLGGECSKPNFQSEVNKTISAFQLNNTQLCPIHHHTIDKIREINKTE